MHKTLLTAFSNPSFRQSKIQNQKSKIGGDCRRRCRIRAVWGCGSRAAAEESPAARLSIGARPARDSARAEAIRLALRERGYIEGQNIAIEYRYAEEKRDRLPELAAELVRLKVDIIIVAGGSGLIRTAKNATKTIPIVMSGSGLDPVEAGLVESLARPGGNVTGFTDLSGHLGGKRLELLKEAVPKVARVAILYQANNPRNTFEFKEVLPVSARALRLTIQCREVRDADDFERVFAAINKERPDGLYVPGDPLMNVNQKRTIGFALESRLPSMYSNREAVEAGGLMSYGADLSGRPPARRIFRGQNPEGNQACRPAHRATNEVRVRDQSQNRETNRPDDSAIYAVSGGQGDQVRGK